jgi:hypothetical protein
MGWASLGTALSLHGRREHVIMTEWEEVLSRGEARAQIGRLCCPGCGLPMVERMGWELSGSTSHQQVPLMWTSDIAVLMTATH